MLPSGWLWHDVALAAVIVMTALMVTPYCVKGVGALLGIDTERPVPAASRPLWGWLTDEGVAWVLAIAIGVVPLLLAFTL